MVWGLLRLGGAFIFGRGCLALDESGTLKVPKHEPLELEERVQHRMYRARVLEGDLSLDHAGPVLWWAIVESVDPEEGGGLQVVVDDVEEFVEGVVGELVDSMLRDMVMDMGKEIACEVCFEEDAPDVWELRCRRLA